jgi:hypothetical protein
MRSLLLAGIVAFGIAGLTTGCDSSTPAPAPAPAGNGAAGVEGPQDSGVKPVKVRRPPAP